MLIYIYTVIDTYKTLHTLLWIWSNYWLTRETLGWHLLRGWLTCVSEGFMTVTLIFCTWSSTDISDTVAVVKSSWCQVADGHSVWWPFWPAICDVSCHENRHDSKMSARQQRDIKIWLHHMCVQEELKVIINSDNGHDVYMYK